jgi:hypothetical protein
MLLVLHEAMTISRDLRITSMCLVVLLVMASKLSAEQ